MNEKRFLAAFRTHLKKWALRDSEHIAGIIENITAGDCPFAGHKNRKFWHWVGERDEIEPTRDHKIWRDAQFYWTQHRDRSVFENRVLHREMVRITMKVLR